MASLLAVLGASGLPSGALACAPFSFQRELFGPPMTLSLFLERADAATGDVVLNGGDSRQPNTPFTFSWGDGTVDETWFPGAHTYADTGRNYVATVTAHYADGTSDSAPVAVWFIAPAIRAVPLPDRYRVMVPDTMVDLASRMPGYGFSDQLTAFGDVFFGRIPRPVVEYVLSAAASVQARMANEDIAEVQGGFRQVVLRDAGADGMYSLWYATPVAMGVSDAGFAGAIAWSSLLHEMGHNATLNAPARYGYGGKIDGSANAIVSETLAQVFQHATMVEMLNATGQMGLDEALCADIAASGRASIGILRQGYDTYLAAGRPYTSWNDPATPHDEALPTFMTLGYRFCAHAETSGRGYMTPVRRMMRLLGMFDETMRQRYDQHHDTPEASAYRATLFVAALSWAFDTDLREEFRDLEFPVDDAVFRSLIQQAAWNDVRRVLGIISGLQWGSGEEIAALDAGPPGDAPVRLDLRDAAILARRASGLEGFPSTASLRQDTAGLTGCR